MDNHNNVGNKNEANHHVANGWTNKAPLSSRIDSCIMTTTNDTSSSSSSTTTTSNISSNISSVLTPSSTLMNSSIQQHQSEEDSDDDYYVYIGDDCGDIENSRMADLPSSLFKFDPSDIHPIQNSKASVNSSSFSTCRLNDRLRASPSSSSSSCTLPLTRNGAQNGSINGQGNGNNGNVFSPDMDFLEMDFDPDVNAEEEDDADGAGVNDEGDDSTGELDEDFNTVEHDQDSVASLTQNCHISSNYHPEDNQIRKTNNNSQSPSLSSSVCNTEQPTTSRGSSSSQYNSIFNNDNSITHATRLNSENSHNNTFRSKLDSPIPGTSKSCKLLDTLKISHNDNSNNNQHPHHDNNYNNSFSQYTSALQENFSSNNFVKVKSANTATVIPSHQLDSRLQPPITASSENQQHFSTVRLVKSITLPQIGQPSRISSFSNTLLPTTRGSTSFSSDPVFGDSYRAVINTSQSSKVDEDLVELNVGRIMIWDEEEANRMSYSQIGKSACGATACLNVLRGLKIDCSPEIVNKSVGTRLRAEDADLPEYLFSRSNAGATHIDLINGVQRVSNDLVFARFFHVDKNIPSHTFSKWLLKWICKGCIPVATRNLQVDPFLTNDSIPDAWHHQMIFGVCPSGIFMNNPVECVPLEILLPQLSSDSVLLIRVQDVISRKRPTTDLRRLCRHSDPRWNDMNVLGQVANCILEDRVRSSHISIPCTYQAGITLFILKSNPHFKTLMDSQELSTLS